MAHTKSIIYKCLPCIERCSHTSNNWCSFHFHILIIHWHAIQTLRMYIKANFYLQLFVHTTRRAIIAKYTIFFFYVTTLQHANQFFFQLYGKKIKKKSRRRSRRRNNKTILKQSSTLTAICRCSSNVIDFYKPSDA